MKICSKSQNVFFWNRWRDKFCTISWHTILMHWIHILRMRTQEEEKTLEPQFPVEINGLINYKTKLNTQYLDSLLSRFVCSKIEIVFVIFIYIASIRWELTPSLPVITGSRYSQVYHNPYITKFILKKEMPINKKNHAFFTLKILYLWMSITINSSNTILFNLSITVDNKIKILSL